jgi:hypothetical protein
MFVGSRCCRCGRGGPSPGADVGEVGPVPVAGDLARRFDTCTRAKLPLSTSPSGLAPPTFTSCPVGLGCATYLHRDWAYPLRILRWLQRRLGTSGLLRATSSSCTAWQPLGPSSTAAMRPSWTGRLPTAGSASVSPLATSSTWRPRTSWGCVPPHVAARIVCLMHAQAHLSDLRLARSMHGPTSISRRELFQ